MARLARLSIAGQPHHLLLRVLPGETVFRTAEDFRFFLAHLTHAARGEFAIHAYVLMADQVQILATPATREALSRTMQSLGRQYVRWFNRRYLRTGSPWQGRYRCTVVEPREYLLAASQFIELQPALCDRSIEAESYPWSSLHHHFGRVVDPVIEDHPVMWALGNTPFERQSAYREFCARPLDHALTERIRWSVQRGWVLGSQAFVSEMAELSDRPLSPRVRGRKRRDPGST